MNLICSFSEELCTSYVLGTVLDTGDNAVIKVDKDPCPLRAFRKNQTLQTKCEVSVISLFFNDMEIEMPEVIWIMRGRAEIQMEVWGLCVSVPRGWGHWVGLGGVKACGRGVWVYGEDVGVGPHNISIH